MRDKQFNFVPPFGDWETARRVLVTSLGAVQDSIAQITPADAKGERLQNLADPVAPADAVNLRTLQNLVGGGGGGTSGGGPGPNFKTDVSITKDTPVLSISNTSGTGKGYVFSPFGDDLAIGFNVGMVSGAFAKDDTALEGYLIYLPAGGGIEFAVWPVAGALTVVGIFTIDGLELPAGMVLKNNSNQVVGARGAALTAPAGYVGGSASATYDPTTRTLITNTSSQVVNLATRLTEMETRLQAHGLIA